MIYDFGANDGVNLDYYLSRDRVVAVEANPRLCDQIRERFPEAIREGRLTVLNVALSDKDSDRPVTFYIHRTNHLLSQLKRPPDLSCFEMVEVICRTPSSIVREHGEPSYIKIDVEGFDGPVLRDLFAAGIFPPEISAESLSVDIFAAMVANGYGAFCLVDGYNIAERFRGFDPHSAGPFGDDIGARWEDADTFLFTLASEGLGWKDIHASRDRTPAPSPTASRLAARQLRAIGRRSFQKLKRKVSLRRGRDRPLSSVRP